MKQLILILTFIALSGNIYAQEDKTVTLTVSGQGKTQDEAKQNALRNAIEQAFGAFISSNTEILNDELVKDEIVSVSNGNIQKFEIISEVQIPSGNYATSLKATVSVSKLTSFVESKGVVVEFKGSLFTFNIKQQILNEKNEQQAVSDLLIVLKQLIDKSFDYSISSGTPEVINGNNENWSIPIILTVKTNVNFLNMYNYLNKTLTSLSLNESEVNDYNALNKQTYVIYLEEPKIPFDEFLVRYTDSDGRKLNPYDKTVNKYLYKFLYEENPQGLPTKAVYLRTQDSYEKIITELMTYFCKSILSIKIEDNSGQNSFSPDLDKSKFNSSFSPIAFSRRYTSSPSRGYNIFQIVQYLSGFARDYKYQSIPAANNPGNGYGYTFGNKILLLNFSGGKEIATITVNKTFTLDQINQLTGFKVTNN